jgi:hypothetical protein
VSARAAAGAAAGLLALLTACSSPAPADTPSPDASGSARATEQPAATSSPEPTVPAPDEHSQVGGIPDDFPSDLLPVPPGAEILVATFAPMADAGADQYAVSLNVRTSSSVDEVLALYRASLTAAGFTESTGAPGASLGAESTFSRSGGQEIVVVGVLDRDGSRTVTAGGHIRTGA